VLLTALAFSVFLFARVAVDARDPAPAYDLLITNARIVDGSGNPWFRADVAIKNGRIERVGHPGPETAVRTIDARGQIVAPGFIDVHTHVESIYNQPAAENFVRMGVTTLVTGNCGSSTTDVAEFLGRMKAKPLAVNLATLIAHGSVRRKVIGLDDRAPTPEELKQMESLVEQGMKDGAVGLSTGLIYVPGTYAKTDEIVALARVAGRYGGLYATHMRNEGDKVADAIRESIQIGEQAGLPVEISHFKISNKKLWGQSPMTLGLVREARARGLVVTVDQYAYTASSTSLDSRLPSWLRAGGLDEAKKRLADKATRERAINDTKDALKRSGFKDYSFAVVASYGPDKSFNGKSIAAITKEVKKKSDVTSQIEQMLEMYEAGGAAMIYHGMGEDDVKRIMQEPFTMIASDSGVRQVDESVPHPRGYGNNARVLGHYVRELKLISLEDAIRKMTSLPAQTFGFRDRGLIREGFAADLVIFDENTIIDQATFDNPHQFPLGISYVVVNGVPVIENNQMTAARPGAALRGPGIALYEPRLETTVGVALRGHPSVSTAPRDEVRALWVVRTTLTSPEKIRQLVASAADNGFNTLIVQIRGRGDAYYKSRVEPRSIDLKDQPESFDPLALTITEAHKRGLKVHGWLNTNLLANLDTLPTQPDHVYNKHPEWLAVPKPVAAELYSVSPGDPIYRQKIVEWSKANRGELEGVYTGPANPKVRDHIYNIWMDVLKHYAVDGLHFDYVRFASPDFDYSRTSLEKFRDWLDPQLNQNEREQLKQALKTNPLAAPEMFAMKFADFQRAQVTTLVERIYRAVKKQKPGTLVSAAVFANDENAYTRRFQDWRRWLQMGILDVACPMAYSTDTAVFQKQIEVATTTALNAKRQVWAGIGAYRIPSDSAVEKINVARALNANGFILFSYDFTARPSELNPDGEYLQRVRRAAF
jgi:N-acyl-D-amino-acid deacylase